MSPSPQRHRATPRGRPGSAPQHGGTSPAARRTPREPDRRRLWIFVALAIIILVSLLRSLHLGFPLERDEGEFGYIGQEILRGVPVYDSAYTQKLPGTYLLYALFLALFGQTPLGIHLGLLLADALTMGLVFLTLRRTHGGPAGCVGALVFGIMALSPTVWGFAAHATAFIALFAAAGLYVLVRARDSGRAVLFFASGVCFGLAFLMKQSGVFFAPLALILLATDHLLTKPRAVGPFLKRSLLLGAGALIPFFLTTAYYTAIGDFSRFWFWTVQLAGQFTGQVGLGPAIHNLHNRTVDVMRGFEILWILALAGFIACLFDRGSGKDRYLYPAFAAASVLSVMPGFFFTNHYYVSLLPAIALLVGSLCGGVIRGASPAGNRFVMTAGVWGLTGAGLIVGIARHEEYFFGQVSDTVTCRQIYAGNPFPESIPIGQYLKDHTTPQDLIAMMGSETQILFYSERRSASRFINTYFLTTDHPRNRDMQREMMADIERVRPKYIVFARFPLSWAILTNSPRDILDWFSTYGPSHYQVEGILQMKEGGSVLEWGDEAGAEAPAEKNVMILRRLDAPASAR